ncbi:MAG: acyl-CoA desaturase [Crocinitomicaceae bacterium]|nr:acyl-CoA desaturase [Crocinitomicaceae bacterium]
MIVAFLLYFTPLTLLCTGIISSPALVFFLYLLSGVGMISIGMNVMHDANHGAFSKQKFWNKHLALSLNLVGANAKLWCVQHNVLHHTYTNIHTVDDDINPPFILRLSPTSKRYKIHRFQHIYAWFVYGLTTLSWITTKDFINFFRYKKMGLIKDKTFLEILKMVIWKLVYYAFALVLPIIFLPVSPWIVVLAFISMHFVVGLFTTIIFQLAHVVPETYFPTPNSSGKIENDWCLHQLQTTANFAPKSKIMSWFIGGLNYQIEHHLFPKVSHIHYRNISEIVRKTAQEFNIQYNVQTNLYQAIKGHARLLKSLGR